MSKQSGSLIFKMLTVNRALKLDGLELGGGGFEVDKLLRYFPNFHF